MAMPPPTNIPPALMNEYYKLAGEYAAAMSRNDLQTARAALQQVYQLSVQNQSYIQAMLQTFMSYMSAAMSAAGMALLTIGRVLALIAELMALGVAAIVTSPEFLIIVAALAGAVIYSYVASGGSPYGNQQSQTINKNQFMAGFNYKSPVSPFYPIETRRLPPGMHVPGLG